jgi:hypothetical protein
MRLRVEVDGEPLAPGAAVSGRIVVEDGGRARELSVRLAFVERTKDFHTVAYTAGEQTVADGELADGAVVAFVLTLPADAAPAVATAHSRIGWELRARADRRGPDAIIDHPVELQRGYTAEDRERWPSG